jgi:hypothetical protein
MRVPSGPTAQRVMHLLWEGGARRTLSIVTSCRVSQRGEFDAREERRCARETCHPEPDRSGGSADRSRGSARTGSTDESIGRPDNWREGRYQRDGAGVDQAVNQPSQSTPKSPPAEQQKPVTLRDYDP